MLPRWTRWRKAALATSIRLQRTAGCRPPIDALTETLESSLVPAWKVGDEVWASYYDWASSNYIAKLHGHVTAVGRDGFTIRRVRPDHKRNLIDRRRHDAGSGVWPTREAAEAYIAAHPFSTGPAGR